MAKTETQLVIAYFDSVDKAGEAAKALQSRDKERHEITVDAIGVLYQTDDGKIKTKKYGHHNTGKGAKVGLLIGVLAALLGPVTLVAGAVYGAAGGGVVGTFSRKGLGLSDEELAHIKTQLADGKVALAVITEPNEVEAMTYHLTSLGGAVEQHDAPTDEIEQVAAEVNAPPPDEVEDATATS
jgi:uncharacterized membrane protein